MHDNGQVCPGAAKYHQHDGLGLEERCALGQVGEVDVPALLGKLRANVGGHVRALDHQTLSMGTRESLVSTKGFRGGSSGPARVRVVTLAL